MKRTLIALSLVAMSSVAFAADEIDFVAVDTDANGSLSLVESQVAMPEMMQEEFDAADMDGNGELSIEEVTALSSMPAAN